MAFPMSDCPSLDTGETFTALTQISEHDYASWSACTLIITSFPVTQRCEVFSTITPTFEICTKSFQEFDLKQSYINKYML